LKKSISIIVPAYNEELCIEELVRRLKLVFQENQSYDFEALIVENGSTDRTWEILQNIHAGDSRFKVIRLARNFRMDGGITAGLHYASGDARVFMTATYKTHPN